MFAFFTIYSPTVWAALFGTLVLFLLSGCFVYWLAPQKLVKRRTGYGGVSFKVVNIKMDVFQIMWHFVRLELLQADSVGDKILSFKFFE
jgi:hypothetical protein